MTESVSDIKSFKEFIHDRTKETWDNLGIPYYLSFVAIDLKKKFNVDYRTFIGPQKLREWALLAELPDTKIITHPTQKAKVGFIPADKEFRFDDNGNLPENGAPTKLVRKHGRALIQLVEILGNLPDEAVKDLHIPAKTLIGLLKN